MGKSMDLNLLPSQVLQAGTTNGQWVDLVDYEGEITQTADGAQENLKVYVNVSGLPAANDVVIQVEESMPLGGTPQVPVNSGAAQTISANGASMFVLTGPFADQVRVTATPSAGAAGIVTVQVSGKAEG